MRTVERVVLLAVELPPGIASLPARKSSKRLYGNSSSSGELACDLYLQQRFIPQRELH